MTEEQYQQLEELNTTMYNLGYDMGDIKDVHDFRNRLQHLNEIVDKLLLMSVGDFVETINTFDKRHFGDNYEN